MCTGEDDIKQARMAKEAHGLAGALENVAANGSPRDAMDVMRVEWLNVWAAHDGDKHAAREEWHQVLKMANEEAYKEQLSAGLPFVQIHAVQDEEGHRRPDIARQVGGHWENWDQKTQKWAKESA